MLIANCATCDKGIHKHSFEISRHELLFENNAFTVFESVGLFPYCSEKCIKAIISNINNAYDQSVKRWAGWRKNCDSCGCFINRNQLHISINLEEYEYSFDGTRAECLQSDELAIFCCQECSEEFLNKLDSYNRYTTKSS